MGFQQRMTVSHSSATLHLQGAGYVGQGYNCLSFESLWQVKNKQRTVKKPIVQQGDLKCLVAVIDFCVVLFTCAHITDPQDIAGSSTKQ